MESSIDSVGLGSRGVKAPFGRDKEIVGNPEEKKQTSVLKESVRDELFFLHTLAEVYSRSFY